MMVGYWVQRHDYAMAVEAENVTVRQAIEAFQGFDWQAELASFDEQDETRNCPPGIGLNNGFFEGRPDGSFLHICPNDGETVFFNFDYRQPRKIFGLFASTKEHRHYVETFPVDRVPELIGWFFEGGIEKIPKLATTNRGDP